MKNIIKFEIEGDYSITHNGELMTGFEVNCNKGTNTICVEGDNFTVKNITMFNLGRNELAKLGEYKNNKYILEYEYPVFTWLHKNLNHGWLIKKD